MHAAGQSGRSRQPEETDRRSDTGGRRNRRGKTSAGPSRPGVAGGSLTVREVEELETLRRELESVAKGPPPLRWNADPEDVQRSVAQLVLTLVEFVRKLLERQAIRRMDAGTLTATQTEEVGRALMQLERTIADIAARFGLGPDDLNLDLGPVGRLM